MLFYNAKGQPLTGVAQHAANGRENGPSDGTVRGDNKCYVHQHMHGKNLSANYSFTAFLIDRKKQHQLKIMSGKWTQ